MDDLTFSARRASTAASARPPEPADLETRFRTLVQSPLRAGILRYLNSRPEESFDVESLMQTFGRLRLDVENCVRELVDFGVAHAVAGTPPRYIAARPANEALPTCSIIPRTPRGRQHRGSVALGPAVPRNDRPRREDADRLRMDPHGGQVGHLGADSRADRLGQGSRRPDDPRAEPAQRREVPGGQLRRAARHALRVGNLRVRERARSPARTIASPAASSWPTRARCSSTRSATCRSSRRPSCCACSRSAASSGSAATNRSRSISG